MSVPELKKADSGIYYIHWTEPGAPGQRGRSKRVSTRTADLAAAKAFLGQWLLMERDGADDASTLTVAELWTAYDAKHVQKKVAAKETASYSWQNLKPHFGALRPSGITQDTVDSYVERRHVGKIGRPSGDSTIRRELGALLACLNWCAEPRRRIIGKGDVPALELPPAGQPRDRWLKQGEMQRLFDAAARLRRGVRLSRVERFLWLALETAARKEAIFQLTWDRVDFETGVIHYNVPGRTVTKKRRASVPISKALRPVLERAFNERIGDHVLDNEADVWATVQLVAIEAGFGGQRPKVLRSEKPKATGVSPHVLRHTAATHMARRGVPLWIIAGILGNTIQQVQKTYAHHCPDGLRAGVEQISAGMLEAAE